MNVISDVLRDNVWRCFLNISDLDFFCPVAHLQQSAVVLNQPPTQYAQNLVPHHNTTVVSMLLFCPAFCSLPHLVLSFHLQAVGNTASPSNCTINHGCTLRKLQWLQPGVAPC